MTGVGDFEAYYRLHFGQYVAQTTKLVGNHADAEEIVQDAFLNLSRQWIHVENPGGWLTNACRWGAKTTIRQRKRRLARWGSADEADQIPASGADPAEIAELGDTARWLLSRLLPHEAEVVALLADGASRAQVAAALAVPVHRVSTAIGDVRARLAGPDVAPETDTPMFLLSFVMEGPVTAQAGPGRRAGLPRMATRRHRQATGYRRELCPCASVQRQEVPYGWPRVAFQ